MVVVFYGGLAALVDVLGEPAEALAVALPLQHAAHEHLQWSRVQLLQGDVALRDKNKKESLNLFKIRPSNAPKLCSD